MLMIMLVLFRLQAMQEKAWNRY